MTELRPRRFHTLVAGPGYFAAICEEGRAWYKSANSTIWEEVTPLPDIENHFAADAGPAPSITPEDLAHFMAQTGAIPALDGMPVLPSPEEHPALTEPAVLTYDAPYKDPIR
jgi:hypothetical protein